MSDESRWIYRYALINLLVALIILAIGEQIDSDVVLYSGFIYIFIFLLIPSFIVMFKDIKENN